MNKIAIATFSHNTGLYLKYSIATFLVSLVVLDIVTACGVCALAFFFMDG